MTRLSSRFAWLLAGSIGLIACDRTSPPGQDGGLTGGSPPPSAAAAPEAPAATPTPEPDSPEGRLLAQDWIGDLDGMLERRYIRVLVIPDKMNFFFDGSQMRGHHLRRDARIRGAT